MINPHTQIFAFVLHDHSTPHIHLFAFAFEYPMPNIKTLLNTLKLGTANCEKETILLEL